MLSTFFVFVLIDLLILLSDLSISLIVFIGFFNIFSSFLGLSGAFKSKISFALFIVSFLCPALLACASLYDEISI